MYDIQSKKWTQIFRKKSFSDLLPVSFLGTQGIKEQIVLENVILDTIEEKSFWTNNVLFAIKALFTHLTMYSSLIL
jgi:hypothetical protein